MLSSAQHMARRFGFTTEEYASCPASGPMGAPQGGYWVQIADVLVHRMRHKNEIEPSRTESLGPFVPPSPKCVLRDYQVDAVSSLLTEENVPRSGIIEMGCGLGKTLVGGEVIRRLGGTSVVITQHTTSVDQWVKHLRHTVGLAHVATISTPWHSRDPLPDVVVLTYSALVRVAVSMGQHSHHLFNSTSQGNNVSSSFPHLLIWMLRVWHLQVLVLDEVHLAAAEHFSVACQMSADLIVGLSGSLVREDGQVGRLLSSVGPVLFRFHASRDVHYTLLKIRLDEEEMVPSARSRDVQARRALHPRRIAALHQLLNEDNDSSEESISRSIVFCDSRLGAQALAKTFGYSLLHGGVPAPARERILQTFADQGGVLVTTKVCDAAIDFPANCRVIQLFSVSGSRQQEMQRCGRGWRGTLDAASQVIHIVAEHTEEVVFAQKRLEHMRSEFGDCVKVNEQVSDAVEEETDKRPLETLFQMEQEEKEPAIPTKQKIRRKRPRL